MKRWQRIVKRGLDIFAAAAGLAATGWLLLICWVAATIDTRENGFFPQQRVGRDGRVFRIIKIRTMRGVAGITTSVTIAHDRRITRLGSLLRRAKADELPQLLNVLLGHMSLVGPRPDVPGFADRLEGGDRIILSVRPGITGPATLAFRDEELLLAGVGNAEEYNRNVIYPAKVRLNRQYVENYSLRNDLLYIAATVIPGLGTHLMPGPAFAGSKGVASPAPLRTTGISAASARGES